MHGRTRYLMWIAGALAAAAIIVPVAQASQSQPLRRGVSDFGLPTQVAGQDHAATLRRGCADFGLTWDYTHGCVSRPTVRAVSSPAATLLRRGCADFGLNWDYTQGCVSRPTVRAESSPAAGFHWNDAGIGAAAMLGLVLIVGGLGAGVVLTRNYRRELSNA